MTTNIYAKLLKARQEFHAIKITKSGHNTFQNYKYFELGDFLIPAMECLANNDLVPVITFTFEMALMRVHDVESGECFDITSPMSSAKLKAAHEIQNLGAVQTYQRRYLWLTLMEVVESDPTEIAKPAVDLATPEQLAAMWDYAEAGKMTDGQKIWLEKASDKISEDQAAYVLEKLRATDEAE